MFFRTRPKIAIVGAGGMVGASTTFSIAMKRIPCDIVMIDVAEKLAQGQCADIQDALTDTVTTVRMGTYSDISDATLVVVTAGVKQQPGEPRSALLRRNLKVLKSICSHIDKERSPHLCIMMVSNPVDVLTYAAQKLTGLPHAQVFGSGTVLDSQRLRRLVAKRLDVDQRHCHVYVLGEHGDKQVAVWSSSTICGENIEKFCAARGICAKELAEQTLHRAYEIIENKGATYFAIGAAVADVLRNLLYTKASIQSLCTYSEEYDCYFSHPSYIDGGCNVRSVRVKSTEDEARRIDDCITSIKAQCKEVDAFCAEESA